MKNIKLDKYKKYKSDDVNWLGEFPAHWEVKRIKDLSSLQSGDNIVSEQIEETGLYPVYGGGGLRGYFSDYTNDGDHILIGRQGALCGNINYASGKFWASEHAVVVYEKRFTITKWYGEILKVMNLNQYSVSAAQPGLAVDRIKRLLLPLPPMPEQQAIADYLDAKTAQIDRKIELLEQRAEKYADLKQSLINGAVTRGLDKTVSMKDSDVTWIGQIPTHWEVKRIKDLFHGSKNKAGSKSGSYKILSLTQNGVIERDIESGKGKFPATFDGYQIVNPDSLLLCLFDMDVTPRIVGYVDQVGLVTSAYTNIIGSAGTWAKYFYFYFLNQDRNKSLLANGKGLRSTLTFDNFGLLKIPLPPLEEQKAIADYLDSKTTQIEKIIETIKLEVEKLQELRKTLINDVMIGKIKVYQT